MKVIKPQKIVKPTLSSQCEIRMSPTLVRTPKSCKSQTFIAVKQSPTSSTKESFHRPSYKTQHKSQFSLQIKSQNQFFSASPKKMAIQECISLVSDIKQTSSMLFKYQPLTADTKQKMESISNIIQQMLPSNYDELKKSQAFQNKEKILLMKKQLKEEKQQKLQAIKSGDSLIQQQAEQIQQLKARISQYQ